MKTEFHDPSASIPFAIYSLTITVLTRPPWQYRIVKALIGFPIMSNSDPDPQDAFKKVYMANIFPVKQGISFQYFLVENDMCSNSWKLVAELCIYPRCIQTALGTNCCFAGASGDTHAVFGIVHILSLVHNTTTKHIGEHPRSCLGKTSHSIIHSLRTLVVGL